MKRVISVLLMFVALSSCQNPRSYEQRIQDYAQTARAVPYSPPQARAQRYHEPPTTTTTTTPEPPRTAPPTRQYYSVPEQRVPAPSYTPQIRVAPVTPVPETIRISFSGEEAAPAQSRMEGQAQAGVKSQSQYDQGEEEGAQGSRSEGQNGNAPRRAAPRRPFIPILRFDQEIQEGVKNHVHFTAANGIEEEEETLINHLPPGQRTQMEYPSSNYGYDSYDNYNYNYDDVEIVKRGKYSYISPEGEHIEVSWIADKDGFRPVGSHIPTVAPVPAAGGPSLPARQGAPVTRQYQYPAPQ